MGLGGLTFGALLARDGWQVEVFDKNLQVGGVCALAEKNGYKWEQGPLILGDLLPGEPVYELLRELGITLETQRAERGIEMPDYAMWRPDIYEGMYWHRARLRKLFPKEKDGIDAYYRFYDDMMELRLFFSVLRIARMPLLRKYIKTRTQHISKEIQGYAYSGNESGSCHQEPKILLPKCRMGTQDVCGEL